MKQHTLAYDTLLSPTSSATARIVPPTPTKFCSLQIKFPLGQARGGYLQLLLSILFSGTPLEQTISDQQMQISRKLLQHPGSKLE